jgi:hypothetical protein
MLFYVFASPLFKDQISNPLASHLFANTSDMK